MKFAVFGDIHGNLIALKAAYAPALRAGADKIYHLGELGGYSPFVNEVPSFLIGHGIEGVQRIYDETVARDAQHCGCQAEDPLQEEMANRRPDQGKGKMRGDRSRSWWRRRRLNAMKLRGILCCSAAVLDGSRDRPEVMTIG